MFNQLYELGESIKKAGIETDSWHKHIKQCPNNKTIIVYIDLKGNVIDIKFANFQEYKKYEPGANGESFPCFNLTELYYVPSESDKEGTDVEQIRKLIKKSSKDDAALMLENFAEMNSEKKRNQNQKVEKSIEKAQRLADIVGTLEKKYAAFNVLIDSALQIYKLDKLNRVDSFLKQLEEKVVQKVIDSDSDESSKWMEFYCASNKPKNFSVILEIFDWQKYEFPFNHIKIYEKINRSLLEQNDPCSLRSDVYGNNSTYTDEKFPKVKLPKLGDVILWSLFTEDAKCYKRYGKQGKELFTVGVINRQRAKDAIEWLACKENENKTWKDISGTCGYAKKNGKSTPIPSVLFAYPKEMPRSSAPLAAMFGGVDKQNDKDGTTFSEISAKVIDALDGIVSNHYNSKVNIFTIVRVSKGQTKILANYSYGVNRIIQGAKEWQKGSQNIPKLSINLGDDKASDWLIPFIPFPSEIVYCLNTIWCRNAQHTEIVYDVRIADGIVLLAENPSLISQMVEDLLYKCISNTKVLLLELGHNSHKDAGSFVWNENTKKYKKHANLLPNILGLLLYKLGYMKGQYMENPVFLVGQIMALADTLHREYCIYERGNKDDGDSEDSKTKGLPRQMIGNAAMTVALDNPQEGLARLSERILIYQAWARTTFNNGLAGWALKKFGEIAAKLENQEIPSQIGSAEKAQLLLGYLSKVEN